MNTTSQAVENKKFDELTVFEKMQVVQTMALFPAITVMVFMRRKIGYRMMKPLWLFVMATIMCIVPIFLPSIASPHGFVFPLYAVAMVGVGLFQRRRCWKEICAGERWHTHSAGVSYLEKLRLPSFFQAHGRIYRFLDPIVCVLVGMVVGLVLSRGLGLWIMFSGLALHIYQQDVYDKSVTRDLDTLDGMIASEVQAETAKHFEGKQPEDKIRTLEETAGIPTGLAPDVHRQVELRRLRHAAADAAAPDNLAAAA